MGLFFSPSLFVQAQIKEWPAINGRDGARGHNLRYMQSPVMKGFIVFNKKNIPYPFRDSVADSIIKNIDTLNGIIKLFDLDNGIRLCYIVPYQLLGGEPNSEHEILMIPYANIDFVRVFKDSLKNSYIDFVSFRNKGKSDLWRLIGKNEVASIYDDNARTFDNTPSNLHGFRKFIVGVPDNLFIDPYSNHYTAGQIMLVKNNKKELLLSENWTFSIRRSITNYINKKYNQSFSIEKFKTIGDMLNYILNKEKEMVEKLTH